MVFRWPVPLPYPYKSILDFLKDSVVHDRCDLTRFLFSTQKSSSWFNEKMKRAKVKKGAVRKMIKVVNSPL